MAYLTPQATSLVIDGASQNVSRYRVAGNGRIAEVTVSGAGFGTLGTAVRVEPNWDVEVPVNSALFPTVLGLRSGTAVDNLIFTGVCTVANTVVETSEAVMDAAGDVVRWRVSGRHGLITWS